jgi:hypothetical protein
MVGSTEESDDIPVLEEYFFDVDSVFKGGHSPM